MRGAIVAVALVATGIGATDTRAQTDEGVRAYVVASDQPAFITAARAALAELGGAGELLHADDGAKARLASARVVVAVGPLAGRLAGASTPDGRLVACLTPLKGGGQTVAVPLQPSPADVFMIVRQVLPSVRKVGVFPGPGRSDGDITASARLHGLDVELARDDEAFATAVDRLVAGTDAIWIDDLQAIPNGGAALVVKKASERKKQVVGPNRATVIQGAFFAVVPDPVAHGRAAGEAALHLLNGDDVKAVPPPLGHIVMNGGLARAFKTKLPPALAQRAELVD